MKDFLKCLAHLIISVVAGVILKGVFVLLMLFIFGDSTSPVSVTFDILGAILIIIAFGVPSFGFGIPLFRNMRNYKLSAVFVLLLSIVYFLNSSSSSSYLGVGTKLYFVAVLPPFVYFISAILILFKLSKSRKIDATYN